MSPVKRCLQFMIRASDFEIEIGQSERGTFVRVTHKPTGNQRCVGPVAPDVVGRTRDSLVGELRRLLFTDEDIRLDTGRAEWGDFIRVVHLPSRIERTAMSRDSSHEELLDAVLEELVVRKIENGTEIEQGQEPTWLNR